MGHYLINKLRFHVLRINYHPFFFSSIFEYFFFIMFVIVCQKIIIIIQSCNILLRIDMICKAAKNIQRYICILGSRSLNISFFKCGLISINGLYAHLSKVPRLRSRMQHGRHVLWNCISIIHVWYKKFNIFIVWWPNGLIGIFI